MNTITCDRVLCSLLAHNAFLVSCTALIRVQSLCDY